MTQGDLLYRTVDVLFRKLDQIPEPERLIQRKKESRHKVAEGFLGRKGNDDRNQGCGTENRLSDPGKKLDVIQDQKYHDGPDHRICDLADKLNRSLCVFTPPDAFRIGCPGDHLCDNQPEYIQQDGTHRKHQQPVGKILRSEIQNLFHVMPPISKAGSALCNPAYCAGQCHKTKRNDSAQENVRTHAVEHIQNSVPGNGSAVC